MFIEVEVCFKEKQSARLPTNITTLQVIKASIVQTIVSIHKSLVLTVSHQA
jgi:hypothetical protein